MAYKCNTTWQIDDPPTWEQVQVSLLQDIRAELQCLRIEMRAAVAVLDKIAKNTHKPKRKRKPQRRASA